MIRPSILAFTLASLIQGAELTVYTSAKAYEDDLVSESVWYSDGSWVDKEPERTVVQEGQIIRQVYRDLKPGKYRIVIKPLGPIGFTEALMEAHVNLEKDSTQSLILIAQEHKKIEIPAELVEAFKKLQGKVGWDLSVRYPGFKDKFYQVRTFSDPKDFEESIHYLRSDGEYTISIWDKDAAKGYSYEKTFRVGEDRQNEKGGTEQPTNTPQLKSEGKEKSQPEAEERSQ